MKKKQAYNPYGLQEKLPLFKKLVFLATIAASLVGTFFFFLLYQILLANAAPVALQEIVYFLSELVSVAALFLLLALVVVTVFREERVLRKQAMRKEVLSLLGISVILRILLYWLTAVIDQKLLIGFHFNNLTLAQLLEGGGYRLFAYGASALINALLVVGMLYLTIFLTKKVYRASGKRGTSLSVMKKLPVFVYLGASFLSAIIETVFSIYDYGISADFSVLFNLVIPYVRIALFSLMGYYFLSYLVDLFEKEK